MICVKSSSGAIASGIVGGNSNLNQRMNIMNLLNLSQTVCNLSPELADTVNSTITWYGVINAETAAFTGTPVRAVDIRCMSRNTMIVAAKKINTCDSFSEKFSFT